ncbi:putative acyltransferase [Aquimarina sp. MAR_2010_214]|uniref:acyltransferase family protein n=1 Tax=Aquimarina sp. MAR_2010_214 TaxID=1250026 RepID=UPI000C714C15|nr:heparan-alpha-glucosaminide N-acetyltransferase domain-containing protein [Aquimarina sp. MAR_2010_214]PKV50304.1 putative acyltransferase [Aquimarina sp. MAR_2010_214]
MIKKQRVQSVDFLRGLTIMLMILVNTPGDWSHVYTLLLHAEWNGLTLADFVFPFFLFIVGISISFVYKDKKGDWTIYKKILMRSLKLVALGLLINVFLPYFPFIETEAIRFPGVLQRIGIIFCVASILYLNCNRKQLIFIAATILIGYWIWLAYIPLPNGASPILERGVNNWANYLDYLLLEGHIWKPDYDPEGILSTLPAIVTTITGIFVGEILMSDTKRKLVLLTVMGGGFMTIGYLWSIFFPINKVLWSSSFVLVTSGYATLFLVLFHYFMDHKKRDFGSLVKYVGANAIIIYFSSMILAKSFYLIKVNSQTSIHQFLFETFFVYPSIDKPLSSFFYALVVVAFYTLSAYFLYKKKIFIKV